jgi:type II secretory pathway predicted ATPase ExeA
VLLQALQDGIAGRTGVTVVIGGSAANRAALCRGLAERARENTFTAVLDHTVHSQEQLLAQLLRDFGIMSRDLSRVGHRVGVRDTEQMEALDRFLRGLPPIDAAAVLVVDRAERLPLPVLAKMTELAGLEDNGRPLLQMVLMGTSEFDAILREPDLASLRAHVDRRYELPVPASDADRAFSTSWMGHRPTVAAALSIALLACALAITASIVLYRQLGF